MCSMSREPRRLEYTICTAVAPEAVLTVRTNGDTPTPYEPHSPGFSVQISAGHTTNTQVTGPPSQNPHDRDPSRVMALIRAPQVALCGAPMLFRGVGPIRLDLRAVVHHGYSILVTLTKIRSHRAP